MNMRAAGMAEECPPPLYLKPKEPRLVRLGAALPPRVFIFQPGEACGDNHKQTPRSRALPGGRNVCGSIAADGRSSGSCCRLSQ